MEDSPATQLSDDCSSDSEIVVDSSPDSERQRRNCKDTHVYVKNQCQYRSAAIVSFASDPRHRNVYPVAVPPETVNKGGSTGNNSKGVVTVKSPPNCSRCRNHGLYTAVKGHKSDCYYKDCNCKQCDLVNQRKYLNSKQKELKLLEEKREQVGRKVGFAHVFSRDSSQPPPSHPSAPPIEQFASISSAFSQVNGGVQTCDRHQIQEALKTLITTLQLPGDSTTTLYLYAILKECHYDVNETFTKICEAHTDMRTYAFRDSSSIASGNHWSTIFPQGPAPSSSALFYPSWNRLSQYYPYTLASSTAAVAAARAAAPPNGTHSPLHTSPIHSLCSYLTAAPHNISLAIPGSSGLGGPGPPPRLIDVTSSGDDRGSDYRDDSDREDYTPQRSEFRPSRENSAESTSSSAVHGESFQPSFSFTARSTTKKERSNADS